MKAALFVVAVLAFACAEVFFKEDFNDGEWKDRWVESTEWKSKSDMGSWETSTGKFYASKSDKGLKTVDNARFYELTAKMETPFNNKDKDLILSFSVRHEQSIDCGGGYIKLLPAGFDQKKFGGDTPYAIMFGPDICGSGTRRTHVILTYKGKNHLIKTDVRCETDQRSHLYTLVLHPDNTYEVDIDGSETKKGSLFEDWDFLPPKEIVDESIKKPADWVDEAKIPDPEDTKPEGWDDIPAKIPDPDATKPDNWNDEDDGSWEAPMIDNPEYKGEWEPKMIDNPEYKGEWKPTMKANPQYHEDATIYNVCDPACEYVGFDLWQVKAGTLFDDILVSDSMEELKSHTEAWKAKRDKENKMKSEQDEEERKEREERRKKEEEEKKKLEEEEGDNKEEEEIEADEEL